MKMYHFHAGSARRKRGCALPHAAFGGASALRPMIPDFCGNQECAFRAFSL
jgi:hypothetical protein